jgi:hypothetical protein
MIFSLIAFSFQVCLVYLFVPMFGKRMQIKDKTGQKGKGL